MTSPGDRYKNNIYHHKRDVEKPSIRVPHDLSPKNERRRRPNGPRGAGPAGRAPPGLRVTSYVRSRAMRCAVRRSGTVVRRRDPTNDRTVDPMVDPARPFTAACGAPVGTRAYRVKNAARRTDAATLHRTSRAHARVRPVRRFAPRVRRDGMEDEKIHPCFASTATRASMRYVVPRCRLRTSLISKPLSRTSPRISRFQ